MTQNAETKTAIFTFVSGLVIAFLAVAGWAYGLIFASTEQHQGEVYRIIYLHVPSAFTAFFCSFMLLVFSIQGLRGKPSSLLYSKATAELGLLYTILTLATGSIWGKPTWGVWWTWDARLTTTFVLSLLYCGYLLLWSSVSGPLKAKVCSVLGILIAADVPVIYKSVTWWRTLHQPPSLLRESGQSTLSPEIKYLLLYCIFTGVASCSWLIWQRSKNLRLQSELEKASYSHLRRQEEG